MSCGIFCCRRPDCADHYCPGRPTRVAKIGQRMPRDPVPLRKQREDELTRRLARRFLRSLAGALMLVAICYAVAFYVAR